MRWTIAIAELPDRGSAAQRLRLRSEPGGEKSIVSDMNAARRASCPEARDPRRKQAVLH